VAPDAGSRLAAGAAWLAARPRDAEVLIVGPNWEACDDFARQAVARDGARFGVVRLTLDRLAARLAAHELAAAGAAPTSALSRTAMVARAVHFLVEASRFTYYAPVAGSPGFAAAVARTLDELRLNGVEPPALTGMERGGRELATIAERLAEELAAKHLADTATIYRHATAVLARGTPWPHGRPVLLLDVPVDTAAEEAFVAALAAAAPAVLAVVPHGDPRSADRLARALRCRQEAAQSVSETSLARLQAHLFEDRRPPVQELDASVSIAAWPDEARECVEIARAIQRRARDDGVPFDQIAVGLHAPGEYAGHLEEAFARAAIPFFMARGAHRPHPAGRALLALLACASEGLSARRFGEYLSLGQVPDPNAAPDPDASWTAPENPLVPNGVAPAAPGMPPEPVVFADPDEAVVVEGTLRAPWRWEQLLVDAAVIGSAERWKARLGGLQRELARRRAELDDGDDGRALRLERTLRDLQHLRDFALPLIGRLASLPARATWGEWLPALAALVQAALREPAPILATLAELEPLGPVGPIDLDEVQLVLAPRLRDLRLPPPRRRYGAVFVAPPQALRGLAFEDVFVPGLAENLVPGKLLEDPILLDVERARLGGAGLVVEADRIVAQRLDLRLAVGAARARVLFSYPRVDVERARPRVPSVYALEVVQAAVGALPSLAGLQDLANRTGGARLGWPAPDAPAEAIDEAEYDLAVLAPLLDLDEEAAVGAASYLLGANAHLERALRARARRWLKRWTPADGLVDPAPHAAAALAAHQLSARSFSPTALQHYAYCPYRFFLQAIHRLAPREEPVAIETMDPLTRGALFHDVQFGILSRLRAAQVLPLRAAHLPEAFRVLDEVLAAESERLRDELFPAIPRVWDDAIARIRTDLREWLKRQADDPSAWVPHRFELSFGLSDRHRSHEDPASVPGAIDVGDGLSLRGSIDLVERHPEGRLRATDHKTGRVTASAGAVVEGGTILQPVFYALVLERLVDEPVDAGRLYYCTETGEFRDHVVPLDDTARAAAAQVTATVGAALGEGFLPAAPRKDACRWCDYRVVCGPWEEERTSRKPPGRLEPLARLRELP
jgi:RecB family exonuclease